VGKKYRSEESGSEEGVVWILRDERGKGERRWGGMIFRKNKRQTKESKERNPLSIYPK